MSDSITFDADQIGIGKTIDLTRYQEVCFRCGEYFVATTPEHLIKCLVWLLTNVDTDTLVTKDGVAVDA